MGFLRVRERADIHGDGGLLFASCRESYAQPRGCRNCCSCACRAGVKLQVSIGGRWKCDCFCAQCCRIDGRLADKGRLLLNPWW
jgi:hypothetical protein